MATQAQVAIGVGGVKLYQKWNGGFLFDVICKAIARGENWENASYLSSTIFCQMIKDNVSGVDEFGIDIDWRVDIDFRVLVDIGLKMIYHEEKQHYGSGNWCWVDIDKVSFADCKKTYGDKENS